MSSSPDTQPEPAEQTSRLALLDVRRAIGDVFAAERRLRGREKRRTDELTLTQSIALIRIDREGKTTAGDLASAAGLNPASVTAMLDQLERSGIVKRTRSQSDRRVVLVSLTELGEQQLIAVRARWDALWNTVFADVSDKDLVVAVGVMRRIAGMIDDVHHPDGSL
jgi:DNA-binding MarR family transcriptional regulator